MKSKTYSSSPPPRFTWRLFSGRAVLTALLALFALSGVQAQYLTEDFEGTFTGTPAAPSGWSQTINRYVVSATGERDWTKNTWSGSWSTAPSGTAPTGAQSGSSAIWINDFNFGGTATAYNSRRMASPTVNLSGSTAPYVRFWYFNNQETTTLASVKVLVSNDGGSSYVTLSNVVNGFIQTTGTGWSEIILEVPAAYRVANFRFAFEIVNRWGSNDAWIDNVRVEEFTPSTITSAAGGDWHNTATWVGGVVPSSGDNVVIAHNVNTSATAGRMARCRDLTVNTGATFAFSTSTTAGLQIFGDLTVDGTFNAFNGTSGRLVHINGDVTVNAGGTLTLNTGTTTLTAGATTFATAATGIVFGGLRNHTFTNNGTLTGGVINNLVNNGSGSVSFASPATVRYFLGLHDGTINAANLTIGVSGSINVIERGYGSLSGTPTWGASVTTRNYSYFTPNHVAFRNAQVINRGNEIEQIASIPTVRAGSSLTMNTYNNLSLNGLDLNIGEGTATAATMTLTRGIVITGANKVFYNTLSATSPGAGSAPTLSVTGALGSYVVGNYKMLFPTSGSGTRTAPLGLGTDLINEATALTSNRLAAVAFGGGAWASQAPIISHVTGASGTVNAPLGALAFGTRGIRVDLDGAPDFTAALTITLQGNNYINGTGNSDGLFADAASIRIAQSTSLSGPWDSRSNAGTAGAIANNTNYSRTTVAPGAPGPIAPLATLGEYFAWASTDALCSGSASVTAATATTGCYGYVSTLSLTGLSGGGLSYQWQASLDNITYTNVVGATSATLPVNVIKDIYYRCVVTCSTGPSTDNSTPIQLTVTSGAVTPQTFPHFQDFESWSNGCATSDVPGAGWANVIATGNQSWRRNDQGASAAWSSSSGAYSPTFQSGAFSARFHSYDVSSGQSGAMDFHVDLSPAGTKEIRFWHINTSGTDILRVLLSTDGGVTFTQLGGNIGVNATWTEIIRTTTSTSADAIVRLLATSDFGVTDIGVDNFSFDLPPTCFPPTALVATPTLTTANISWTAPIPGNPAVQYFWEVRTSGAPGSGPTGLVASGTTALTSAVASGLSASTSYTLYVRTDCTTGPADLSAWASFPFTTLPCIPVYTTGISAGDLISNFEIVGSGLSNNTGFATSPNISYTFYQAPPANLTGTLAAGTSYTVNVSTGEWGDQNIACWIDFNNNGVFETPSERIGFTPVRIGSGFTSGLVNASASFTISLPCNPTPGSYRLRVRTVYSTSNIGSTILPCASYTWGETEDYTVTVAPPPPCPAPTAGVTTATTGSSATLDWTTGCAETLWDVHVTTPGGGNPGAGAGSDENVTKPYVKTGLAPLTTYEWWVRADCGGSQSVWSGPYTFSTPPANDLCADAIALTMNTFGNCPANQIIGTTAAANEEVADPSCDDPGNYRDVWYTFTTGAGQTEVYIYMTLGTASFVGIEYRSGGCAGSPLFCDFNATFPNPNILTGLTPSTTYHLRVFTNVDFDIPGTFNICASEPPVPPANDNCAGAQTLTVNPTLTCATTTNSTTVGATQSSETAPTCSAAGTNDDVWFSFTATQATHRITLTNIAPAFTMSMAVYSGSCGSLTQVACIDGNTLNLSGLTVSTVYYVRVYTQADDVLSPGVRASFTICVATPPPPPANDECATAIAFPTIPTNQNCANVTVTTTSATASGPASCTGTADDDVWYSFVVPTGYTTLLFSTTNISGSGDRGFQIFDACGGASVFCSDPESGTITGLTPGATYYLRTYTWFSGAESTFTLCLRVPPPAPSNDLCTNAIAFPTIPLNGDCALVTTNTLGATGTLDPTCTGAEDDDVWFTFTTPAGVTSVNYNNINIGGSSNDRVLQLLTSCGGTSLGCFDPESGTFTGLTPSTTYVLRAYTWGTGANSNFSICLSLTPPPPANDDFCNAQPLTVNNGCVFTPASNRAATSQAGVTAPSCGSPVTDVWFSFVVPASGNVIINTQLGTGPFALNDGVMAVYRATGACPTLTFTQVPGACNDDGGPGLLPYLQLNTGLTAGETLYIRFWGFAASGGTFGICVSNGGAPAPANDSPLNAQPLSISGNAFPNCGVVTGDLTLATNSPQSPGIGNDVWFRFTAQSTAVSITMSSSGTDNILSLHDASYNLLPGASTENLYGVGVSETLNYSGLTPGQQYFISCGNAEAVGGATFQLCFRNLLPSFPADGLNQTVQLCTNYKPQFTGATLYTFVFTPVFPTLGSVTSASFASQIPLSTAALALRYGGTYTVRIDAQYNNLTTGNGSPDTPITVTGVTTGTVNILPHAVMDNKATQLCPATLLRGSVLSGKPFICGALNFTVEFRRVSACTGGSYVDPLPFEVTTAGASSNLPLGFTLPQPLIAQSWYEIRWRPNFTYGSGTYGPYQRIFIGGSVMEEGLDLNAVNGTVKSTGSFVEANLYPNPNNGDMVNLNVAGVESDNVFVRIMDGMGRVVYTNRYTVDGSLNTIVTFAKPLAAGLYMVEFTVDGEILTERMMVQK